MTEKKTLSKIKSGVFSRGFALARASVEAGARAATHAVGNIFADPEQQGERLKTLLSSQMKLVSRELGELKGSLMKLGQMLSVYGEHFLPAEANAFLKTLQSQSPPLEWAAIEKVLKRQFGKEKLSLLEIDHEPIASASLGQVHRAKLKTGGPWLAMKIQYPGVDTAIDGDLKALKTIFSIAKIVPMSPKIDHLFEEVRTMLHQEVDYEGELKHMEAFRKSLAGDMRYVIPEATPEFCTKRVLTMNLEEGSKIDSAEIRALSQERRNLIAEAALELYFRELFELKMMQTDPHFGNYRIRVGEESDQLVLFDFGAVRKFNDQFLGPYSELIRGSLNRDQAMVVRAAGRLGFILPEDPKSLHDEFFDLCQLIIEPFATPDTPGVSPECFDSDGNYLWGKGDLPRRVAKKTSEIVFGYKPHSPPSESVFLDRKMGGIFVFLSVLDAKIKAKPILEKYLSLAYSSEV